MRDSPSADPRQFHRDRRMLLYELTWPAVWLDRRGLTCPQRRYSNLIAEHLDAIRAHGDPACYNAYFRRYLLKCLQNWFEHYGDDLYGDLKHIRNALGRVAIRPPTLNAHEPEDANPCRDRDMDLRLRNTREIPSSTREKRPNPKQENAKRCRDRDMDLRL